MLTEHGESNRPISQVTESVDPSKNSTSMPMFNQRAEIGDSDTDDAEATIT